MIIQTETKAMKIKVNTHVIVGSKQQPAIPGSVVEKVSKEEADALVAAGPVGARVFNHFRLEENG